MNKTLEAIVKATYKDTIVFHVSRDPTAMEAREKAAKKTVEKKEKRRRERPKNGEKRLPPQENKLEKQIKQSAQASIQELDKACSYGCKKKSQGNMYFWKGYKLHLYISDSGFPLNAVITCANTASLQYLWKRRSKKKYILVTVLWTRGMTQKR
jgi:hypothetical protein